ncbi:MAG: WYL domain-containing protein [Oscillibacter sp.]|nr:WYL domain-containing protein [Oscillibacter sp.]
MAKSENQKVKTLFVAKFFLENSDENHPVTAGDITDYLKNECGIESERRAIYRDIAALRDVFGMDIDGGQGGKYRLLSRQFEFDDLRLLAECVHAAKFISAPKAKDLVSTIAEFCSSYQAEELQREVFLCDRVKTTRKDILLIIGIIQSAMSTRENGKPKPPQKISFKYLKYTLQNGKTQVERRRGAAYKVSPYKLLINEGNYYLLAYDDKAQDMRTYRIDRMKEVKALDEPREGEEAFAAIDMETYTRRVFSMYGGPQKRVSVRFINPLLDTAIERFGTAPDVFYRPDGERHFVVTADVEISDQFFSWVCGFRKKAKIINPPDVVENMQKFLKDISDRYET